MDGGWIVSEATMMVHGDGGFWEDVWNVCWMGGLLLDGGGGKLTPTPGR